jgi:acyl-CoA thioesterase YciA
MTKASDQSATVRARAMPADTNPAGDIFGGWLLSQMDMAGEIAARQHARKRVATVAIDAMTFHKPVHVGDVVSCYTRIVRTGNTSVTVEIKAVAMRENSGRHVPVTEGLFVYVALDENGQPAPIAPTG